MKSLPWFNKAAVVLTTALLSVSTYALDAGVPKLTELKPLPQQSQAARLAAEILTRYHYKTMPLDDAMSEKIFDQYMKSLDPEKMFLIQADIDQLAANKKVLDDAVLDENLNVPFRIYNRYAERATERYDYARSLLNGGFDFDQDESFQFTRKHAPWAANEAELRDLWRKRVKNDWLRLKLAGKDDKSIVSTLNKRYETTLKRIARLKSEDAFQIFMNAYTTAIEPHTNYLGPRRAEEFDISMKLSLTGIGATLTERDDLTTVRDLVPGGPAALSGKIKIGDRIVGVGQGEQGEMIDVRGWRQDDAVALIRGGLNTVVRLEILPAGVAAEGKTKVISLVRKKITLADQSAKKEVMEVKEGGVTRKIGVISLPGFYEDFEARRKNDPNYKSAARDVARLLGELKKDNVDSVLMDLRNNGGGSLAEAIELTGMFIGLGPVVQQRDAKGAVVVGKNNKDTVLWAGPLGVLINQSSASASEIFAAAIQDYGRGLVIGTQSFGKGTVQGVINLDRIAKNDKPKYGEIKLTIAQFFRVNGGTTQLRGVTPDIAFPSVVDPETFGELSYTNALPWVEIKPANYSPSGDINLILPALQKRHVARTKLDKEFEYLNEDIAEFKQQREKNKVSLNQTERRAERKLHEARDQAREAQREKEKRLASKSKASGSGKTKSADRTRFRDDGLQAGERSLATEIAEEKADKTANDVLLNEAVNILADEISVRTTLPRLIAEAKAAPNRQTQ
jgi:carboxyl-terminal processing protease